MLDGQARENLQVLTESKDATMNKGIQANKQFKLSRAASEQEEFSRTQSPTIVIQQAQCRNR